MGEDQEIAIARGSVGGTVAVRMFINDIVADPGVNSGWNRQPVGRGQDAQIPVRVVAFENPPPDVLTQSQRETLPFRDPIVQLASFAPQAEFTGPDVSSHAFGGGALAGQLVVVNGTRAIHSNVINEAAL